MKKGSDQPTAQVSFFAPAKKEKEPKVKPLAAAKALAKAKDQIEWLRVAKKQAEEMYAEARAAESFVAAEKCLSTASRFGVELAAAEAADLASKGAQSEEAFLVELRERLANLPLPYLEEAVTEYLRRHPGVRLTSDA